MPSTDTISAFNEFTPETTIKSAEVNDNFSIYRGHIIPVDPTAASSVTDTYDLGSSTYKWRYLYQGQHEVFLHTGNGHGSTNTKIRRFSTADINTGTAITYTDDASLGASFTIDIPGIYAMSFADAINGSTGTQAGISVNGVSLSTNISAVAAGRIAFVNTPHAGFWSSAEATTYLNSSDIVRPHTNGSNDSVSPLTSFRITKVG